MTGVQTCALPIYRKCEVGKCNLGKALVEQGIEQGVEKKNLSLAKMMIKDKESLDKIEKYTGFSADKLKEIAASIGTNLTA